MPIINILQLIISKILVKADTTKNLAEVGRQQPGAL